MRKIDKFNKKIYSYFFDHRYQYAIIKEFLTVLLCVLSGAMFGFGFSCFTKPFVDASGNSGLTIVTGGVSGLSQNVELFLQLFNVNTAGFYQTIYIIVNIPLLVFAYFKISKRFAIYSLINVFVGSLCVSIFTNTPLFGIPISVTADQPIAYYLQSSDVLKNSAVTRALLGGVCTGISAALAFKVDVSCGGMDIISYYLSTKKSTGVGKYSFAINGFVIGLYAILMLCKNSSNWPNTVLTLLHSAIYILVASLVIDVIHVRNKKVKVEIVTSNEQMSDILITIFPHSATIMHAQGAYSHSDKVDVCMIVSSNEVKKLIQVARKVDDKAFIACIPLSRVYGNFFSRPIE